MLEERRRVLVTRSLALALSAICALAAWKISGHHSSHPILGPYSLAPLVMLAGLAAASLAALTFALLPRRHLLIPLDAVARLDRRYASCNTLREARTPPTRTSIILALLLLEALFLLATAPTFIAHTNPIGDEQAYLNEGLHIQRNGGITGCFSELMTGRYPYDNRHPFYSLAISPMAEPHIRYYFHSKWIALAGGALALLALFWATLRLFGLPAAFWAGLLLAANPHWRELSVTVGAEPFTAAAGITAIYLLIQSIRTNRSYLWAGAAIGIAYWTKGIAILFFPVLALALVAGLRPYRKILPALALCLLAFIAVVWPISVNNIQRGRQPFYNVNSTLMWMDEWDDLYSDKFLNQTPSPALYFARHPIYAPAIRIAKWLPFSLYEMIRGIGIGTGPSSLNILSGFILTLLALLALLHLRTPTERFLIASLAALFLVFFAWYYPIGGIPVRFFLPVTFCALMLAGGAIATILSPLDDRLARAAAPLGNAAVLIPVILTLAIAAAFLYRKTPPIPQQPSTSPNLLRWIQTHADHKATWLIGQDLNIDFFWMLPENTRQHDWLLTPNPERAASYARSIDAQYLVVTSGLSLERTALSAWFVHRNNRLERTATPLPNDWTPAASGNDNGNQYLIYTRPTTH